MPDFFTLTTVGWVWGYTWGYWGLFSHQLHQQDGSLEVGKSRKCKGLLFLIFMLSTEPEHNQLFMKCTGVSCVNLVN